MVYTRTPAHISVTFEEEEPGGARLRMSGSQRSLGAADGIAGGGWQGRQPNKGHGSKPQRNRSFKRIDSGVLGLDDFLGEASESLHR